MFADIELFRMSSAMAAHAGRRQSLTAQNMANVDTPGFRAKRLAKFTDISDQITGTASLKATRATHMHGAAASSIQSRVEEITKNEAIDGNTVKIETEMLEAIGAKREHDRALAIYRSTLNILHSTLGRS